MFHKCVHPSRRWSFGRGRKTISECLESENSGKPCVRGLGSARCGPRCDGRSRCSQSDRPRRLFVSERRGIREKHHHGTSEGRSRGGKVGVAAQPHAPLTRCRAPLDENRGAISRDFKNNNDNNNHQNSITHSRCSISPPNIFTGSLAFK